MRIALIGFMGSGKSTYGEALAKIMELDFIDLDHEIELRAGKNIRTIFSDDGEKNFRKTEAECLREIFRKDQFVLACGGGTPVSPANRKLLLSQSRVIFLKPLFSTTLHYLRGDKNKRPLLGEISKKNFPEEIEKLYRNRLKYYCEAPLVIDPDFLSPGGLVNYIRS